MRRHAKASSAGSTSGTGSGRGLLGRAFAVRGVPDDAAGTGAPAHRRALPAALGLVLLLGALAFALAGTAQASKAVFSTFGSSGTGAGQFGTSSPADAAVNTTGNGGVTAGDVYVADRGGNRIEEFSSSGTFVRAFGLNVGGTGVDVCTSSCVAGTSSAAAGGLAAPWGVAIDQSNGNVYVNSLTNRRVDVFSATGEFEGAFGWKVNATTPEEKLQFCTTATGCAQGSSGAGGGQFSTDLGFPAVAPAGSPHAGDVYIADYSNLRVDEFTPTITAGKVTGVSFDRSFGWGVVSTGPGNTESLNQTQSLKVNAQAGTYTLTFSGQTTASIPFNAPASGSGSVQEALQSLSTVGGAGGTVAVSGGPGNFGGSTPYFVTFGGSLGGAAADPLLTATGSGSGVTITVTSTPGLEQCEPARGDVCKAGTTGAGFGQFGTSSLVGIAVDSAGSVYTVNTPTTCAATNPCRVQKFNAAGTSASEFAPSKLSFTSGTAASEAAFNVAIDPSDQNVLVAKVTSGETQIPQFTSSGESVDTSAVGAAIPVPTSGNPPGLALGTGNNLYLSDPATTATKVYLLNTPPAPTVSIGAVTGVGTTTATLNGTVTPVGFPTTYHFEYSPNGAVWSNIPLTDVSVGSGTSPVPVSQEVNGLQPNTAYHVRLVATDGTSSTSTETGFETAAAPPLVFQVVASPVTATTAKLTGYVNPQNSLTSYRFEWGTTSSYGHLVPAETLPYIGSDAKPHPVEAQLSGLQPGTTYHFRLLAKSTAGTTEGLDETFETLPASCPNEALRAQSDENPNTGRPYSQSLPDCRAYEQVSVVYKAGWYPQPHFISEEGNAVQYFNKAATAGAESNPVAFGAVAPQYLARRTAAGWQTAPESLPQGYGPVSGTSQVPQDAPADLSKLLYYVEDVEGAALKEYFFANTLTSPPSLTPVGIKATGFYEGASSDFSVLVFDATEKLLPVDTSSGISGPNNPYAISGANTASPTLSYIPVDNSGNALSTSTTAGVNKIGSATTKFHAISTGGTVFFAVAPNATYNGITVSQVFARDVPESTTTDLSEPTVANCSACNTTTGLAAGEFQGAAADGSRVFFSTAQALLPADANTGNDLYVYDFESPAGQKVALASGSDPTHPPASPPGSAGNPGAVQGVVRISRDGSHLFFVDTARLTTAANKQGQTAQSGADNLYVYEPDPEHAGSYKTVFIADLCSGLHASGSATDSQCAGSASDSALWGIDEKRQAQATPDGRYLLFASNGQLTPDDTSTVAQVFRYDAQTGELLRVSGGVEGYDNDGNTTTNPAAISAPFAGNQTPTGGAADFENTDGAISYGRAMSDNGSYLLFSTKEALTPDDTNNATDLYEWHDGDVSLLSDGTNPTGTSIPPGPPAIPAGVITPDGKNVFFLSRAQLVGQDNDQNIDIYDARVEGGFPYAPAPAACAESESCQGPASRSASTEATPGSSTFSGPGNEATPPPAKHHKKPKKHRKRHHKRHATRKRG